MPGIRSVVVVIFALFASAWPASADAQARAPAAQMAAPAPSVGRSPAHAAAPQHELGVDAGRFFTIDQHGIAHLAYGGGQLYYATEAGAGWQYEVADAHRGAGGWPALALLPDDTPLIAYVDTQLGKIKLAHRTASGWASETVTTTTGVRDLALAVDSGGRPHLAFVTGTSLIYMFRTNGSWPARAFPGVWGEAHGDFLALDGAGRPHLAYASDYNQISHEWLTAAGWQAETAVVLSKPNMYQHYEIEGLSLAVNSRGVAGLAYAWKLVTYGGVDQYGSDFTYLAGVPAEAVDPRAISHVAASTLHPMAPRSTYSYRPSLSFGPDDTPHMADAAGMYAYWTAAGPVGEQYRGFQPEETCSLALDLDGSPQIACVGSLLRLYRRTEAGWTSQTLAESNPFGERLWLPLVCGH